MRSFVAGLLVGLLVVCPAVFGERGRSAEVSRLAIQQVLDVNREIREVHLERFQDYEGLLEEYREALGRALGL